MPTYVAITLPMADVDEVVDSMRRAGAAIITVSATPHSKRISAIVLLDCSDELAIELRKIKGVKHLEEEIHYHPFGR
jgi:hypothetical protein